MAGRGGSREGAGRKPKRIELDLQVKQNTAQMIKSKLNLLSAVHADDVITDYVRVVKEMLNSNKAGERRDAVKILTDIMLKTDIPEEKADTQSQTMTSEILINKLRAERAQNPHIIEEEDDSTSEVQAELPD